MDDFHARDGDERERNAHLTVQRIKVLKVGAVLGKLLDVHLDERVVSATIDERAIVDLLYARRQIGRLTTLCAIAESDQPLLSLMTKDVERRRRYVPAS